VKITQAARGVLYVGFEVENGIAVACKTIAREPLKFGHKKRARLPFRAAKNLAVQFLEERLVAIEEPPVQHGQMEFGVVLFNAPAFFEGTSGGAHPESQIPQGTGKFRNQRPRFFLAFFAAEQKQEIQVRVGEEHFAAVTAECEQGQSLRPGLPYALQFAEDLADGFVGQFTQLPQRFLRACAAFKELAYPLSLGFALRGEHGQRCYRIFHFHDRRFARIQTWTR
jgi:hypothetical protein